MLVVSLALVLIPSTGWMQIALRFFRRGLGAGAAQLVVLFGAGAVSASHSWRRPDERSARTEFAGRNDHRQKTAANEWSQFEAVLNSEKWRHRQDSKLQRTQ